MGWIKLNIVYGCVHPGGFNHGQSNDHFLQCIVHLHSVIEEETFLQQTEEQTDVT